MLVSIVKIKNNRGKRILFNLMTYETSDKKHFMEVMNRAYSNKGIIPICYYFPRDKRMNRIDLAKHINGTRPIPLNRFEIYETNKE